MISDEIKKIEAGLYYLKLIDIDKEIRVENEINSEAETEVEGFNKKISEIENQIKLETDKVNPLRERNIENLSKVQRLNLELQSLDEENLRIQEEIGSIKKSLQIIDEDIIREKGIVIDANSNEKRLKEEKNELIEVDSKYFETEKLSNEELEKAKSDLDEEQKLANEIIKTFADGNININVSQVKSVEENIDKIKSLINENELNQALTLLDRCKIELNEFLKNLGDEESKKRLSVLNEKNDKIKSLQNKYTDSFSKNQSIKKESLKRNERIKTIETEIESWINLLSNSNKMINELTERKKQTF